jgi:hypothetical protein
VPRRLLPALLAAATLTLPACGAVKFSADTLTAAEVAAAAEGALETEEGVRPDVTCPEELAKEEGASTRCTLVHPDGSREYGVTVTVTSTDDTTQVRIDVDDRRSDDEHEEDGASG